MGWRVDVGDGGKGDKHCHVNNDLLQGEQLRDKLIVAAAGRDQLGADKARVLPPVLEIVTGPIKICKARD